MKLILSIFSILILTACATKDYQHYVENTAKMVAAANASEAACFLVVAEGVKAGDNSTKTAIATQIEKCKKQLPNIEPPKKNWLGF